MPHVIRQQNLKVSSQYLDFISKNARAIVANLYKFTSALGAVDTFTDLDMDVNYGGFLWKSGSLRISGLLRKTAIGLQVDEQTMKIAASPDDTLFGSLFLIGAEQGLLDGALIQRYRAVWPVKTGNAVRDVTDNTPLAVYCLFTGYTADMTDGGVTSVAIKVRSALSKLEVSMPQNYYQPGCGWTLYSANCTLIKQAFAVSGVVGSGATPVTIPVIGGLAGLGLDNLPQYAQGRLEFFSGANTGLEVLIDTNDTANLYLAYALDQVPAPNDAIVFYPGCSKIETTCKLKWANEANFRGFDKVPPVSMSI